MQSAASSFTKFILGEVVGDIFYAPIWWYSRGLFWIVRRLQLKLVNFERKLGLRLWLRTLGKPMYGQRDIAGKIISFFMRLAVLIFRSVLLLIYAVGVLLLFLLWIFVPPFTVWQFIAQFVKLISA